MHHEAIRRLLATEQTPLYLYDGGDISMRAKTFKSVLHPFQAYYSIKANPLPPVCKLLARLGFGGEVVTIGEMQTAIKAGFSAKHILFAGPAKDLASIDFALKSGIRLITAESLNQVNMIEGAAKRRKCKAQVLLRINESALRSDHCESMMGVVSQFGLDVQTWLEELKTDGRLLNTEIVGTQYYSASQVLDPHMLPVSARHQMVTTKKVMESLSLGLTTVDIGGGFGIPYEPHEKPFALDVCARELRDEMKSEILAGLKIIVESGRYIVGPSGVFLTRVVDVKSSAGRLLALCDGGMVGFTRPALLKYSPTVELLQVSDDNRKSVNCTMCGFSCSSLDVFGTYQLPHPKIGDILMVKNAGAYGHSMSIHSFHCSKPIKEIFVP